MPLKRLLAIIFLAILSFPAGYLIGAAEKPYQAFGSDWLMMLIAGGIACFIVLGGISWLVYAFFRKTQPENAFKRALQVYAFFAVILLITGCVRYPEARAEYDKWWFMESFRPVIEKEMYDVAESEGIKDKDYFNTCVRMELESDEAFLGAIMRSRNPKREFIEDPRIDRIIVHCLEMSEE